MYLFQKYCAVFQILFVENEIFEMSFMRIQNIFTKHVSFNIFVNRASPF